MPSSFAFLFPPSGVRYLLKENHRSCIASCRTAHMIPPPSMFDIVVLGATDVAIPTVFPVDRIWRKKLERGGERGDEQKKITVLKRNTTIM